jgi:hypothetical protein
MVQTKIFKWHSLFQKLILFTVHYGNLEEMLEMASFLKYVDLYLTSEWGRFYMGHSVDWKAANWITIQKIRMPGGLSLRRCPLLRLRRNRSVSVRITEFGETSYRICQSS